MQMHNYAQSTFQVRAVAQKPFTTHGCDSLDAFRKAHPGDFVQLPEGYEACKAGFRPYRCADGRLIGLKLD